MDIELFGVFCVNKADLITRLITRFSLFGGYGLYSALVFIAGQWIGHGLSGIIDRADDNGPVRIAF